MRRVMWAGEDVWPWLPLSTRPHGLHTSRSAQDSCACAVSWTPGGTAVAPQMDDGQVSAWRSIRMTIWIVIGPRRC